MQTVSKRLLASIVLSVAFVVYAVLTGGILLADHDRFDAQGSIQIGNGVQSHVWLAPTYVDCNIPFVFHYAGSKTPFKILLRLSETTWQFQRITVTEVILQYQAGEVVRNDTPWTRAFETVRNTQGLFEYEIHDSIDGLILRHSDLKVTLRGYLTRTTGEEVAFEASDSFKAASWSGISTYWYALAQI